MSSTSKPIYESRDGNDPVVPNFQYTNLIGSFANNQILTGTESGAKAQVVSFDSQRVYYVYLNDNVFAGTEKVTTETADCRIVVQTIVAGSTNITTSYNLDNGQREQYYDYSRLVRKSGPQCSYT